MQTGRDRDRTTALYSEADRWNWLRRGFIWGFLAGGVMTVLIFLWLYLPR